MLLDVFLYLGDGVVELGGEGEGLLVWLLWEGYFVDD